MLKERRPSIAGINPALFLYFLSKLWSLLSGLKSVSPRSGYMERASLLERVFRDVSRDDSSMNVV